MTASDDSAVIQLDYTWKGIGYHATARFALIEKSWDVPATLAHHAVEMLLKGALCDVSAEAERRTLGHRLSNLWDAAVAAGLLSPSPRLRDAIVQLDRFERIRYPEALAREGAEISLGWDPGVGEPIDATTGYPRYRLSMGNVDELVDVVLNAIAIDAAILRTRFSANLWRYFEERNEHITFWC